MTMTCRNIFDNMKGALSTTMLLALVASVHGINMKQCCPGQFMLPRGYCYNSTERINLGCENGHFQLMDIVISEDGLSTRDTPGYIFALDEGQYCVGDMRNSTEPLDTRTVPVAVVCFQKLDEAAQRNLRLDEAAQYDIRVNGILALVSSAFLILTVSVYIFLPQLRDLQGKCIMCMCGSMALGFFSLGIMQVGSDFHKAVCTINGFLIYFWLMATFLWMNVVSINVLRSVSQSSYLKKTEGRQFFFYSLYAWGGAIVFLVATLITNYVEGEHIRPGFGGHNCWFKGDKETWVFFYGPMAVLIATNVILFVLTSLQLWHTAKTYEVSALKRLKYKFLLYLKLCIVMGLSWIFEIASFAHAQSHIVWRIADIFNCLQGVVFFLLLIVLRKRTLIGLTEKGVGGAVTRKLLHILYKNEEDHESMVTSEQETANAYAPHTVNLN